MKKQNRKRGFATIIICASITIRALFFGFAILYLFNFDLLWYWCSIHLVSYYFTFIVYESQSQKKKKNKIKIESGIFWCITPGYYVMVTTFFYAMPYNLLHGSFYINFILIYSTIHQNGEVLLVEIRK